MLKMVLDIQRFAHVKAQGSTHNGRDSAGRRLGAKAADGEFVSGGSIIYRQRGTKIYPGHNVGMGVDHTLYAKVAVYVNKLVFMKKNNIILGWYFFVSTYYYEKVIDLML